MKQIGTLLKRFFLAILSIFEKAEPEKPIYKTEYKHTHTEPEPIKSVKYRGPAFGNCRKRTRGRKLQVIELKNGKTRVIKHTSRVPY